MQLAPWTQKEEHLEADAPCIRREVERVAEVACLDLGPHISGSIAKITSSCDCYMQLVPWTQEKENQEPDAPCTRLNIEGVNKVVFQDLKLSWDELDFIGIKKVHLRTAATPLRNLDRPGDWGRPCKQDVSRVEENFRGLCLPSVSWRI